MALRSGDRTQITFLPPSIDEFVSSDCIPSDDVGQKGVKS